MSSAHSPSFVTSTTSQLILQPFPRFTYVTTHSPTLPVASPTSQLILQPFFRLSYVTGFSLTSPGEPPMLLTRTDQIQTSQEILKLKWNWIGHKLRKQNSIEREALKWNPQGQRKRGGPKGSWKRSVHEENIKNK